MISIFDMFKIGIGPSSSHTVGPMVAANRFAQHLGCLANPLVVARITIDLFGSLALTGLGHRTDLAVIMGLCGELPKSIDPESVDARVASIQSSKELHWLGKYPIQFDYSRDLIFNRTKVLPQHPNGLRFTALDSENRVLTTKEYFSVGGGFVLELDEVQEGASSTSGCSNDVPYPFTSADELLSICKFTGLPISEVVRTNELANRSQLELEKGIDEIWAAMKESIEVGCRVDGILPGGLGIRRRAPDIHRKLASQSSDKGSIDPLQGMDWVALFALAVNEQNAAGGRVVTAPTNGAAGVIPAVVGYYEKFVSGANRHGVHNFLLTASAIGMLYKRNASLSAAEMGCQGEVGVACSMAAAGLAAVMDGTPSQIENAAEIGMEHNLGLTCDPVAGLVQVPCIERNTMGAIKAINAARLAVLYGDGSHRVSLDRVIETMRQTGVDMQTKYKETSLGGLAVNVVNC
jgi:L-serine dehydratase